MPEQDVTLDTIAEVGAVEGADVIISMSSFFTLACSNYYKQMNKRVPQKLNDSYANPLPCTYLLPLARHVRLDYSAPALEWMQRFNLRVQRC